MGFVGPEPALPAAFGCKLDHRGNIVHDDDFMTTAPGVFSAGDCSRGPVTGGLGDQRRSWRGAGGRQVPDVRRVGPAGLLDPAGSAYFDGDGAGLGMPL